MHLRIFSFLQKSKFAKYLIKLTPFLVILIVVCLFFWKFITKGLVPIPADIISGTYFPWFDLRFPGFPAGIPVKNTALSDVVSIIYPWRKLVVDIMKSGYPPLWNHYILSGNWLLANVQSAAFYPLNIIFWLTNRFSFSWSILVILQPFLASIFMYLFLRENKLSKISSLFGSIVWGFNGYFLVWLEYNTLVHAALYFPLMLLSLQKGVTNNKYYVVLALAIAFSLLAGYPLLTIYELVFAGIYFLFVLPRFEIKKSLLALIFVLLGMGLTAPAMMPTYNIFNQSIRTVDSVASSSHAKYILPKQFITIFAPDFFGNPATRNFWLTDTTYENTVLYAGIPILLFFLISIFIKKNRLNRKLLNFSLLIFIISLALSIKSPVSEFFGNIGPMGSSASVMGRIIFITIFAVDLGGSILLDGMIKEKILFRKMIIPIIISIFFVLIPGVISIISLKNNSGCQWCLIGLRNLAIPTALIIIGWILILSVNFLNGWKKYFAIFILVTIAVLDLFRFHSKYNSFSSPLNLYPENAITSYIKSQGLARFESEDGPIIPPNMWIQDGLYSASGQDTVHSIRYNKFINFINTGSLEASNRYVKINNFSSKLIDYLGIKYIAAIKWKNGSPDFAGIQSYKFREEKFKLVFEKDRSLVLENTKAYPLMFSVNLYTKAVTDKDFENLLSTNDLSKIAILEEDIKGFPADSKVVISNLNFKPISITADIKSTGNSLIILTETYSNDWKAYIDGKKIPIYRANYAFMAMPITSGNHSLVIKYIPQSFSGGIIVGTLSAVLIILFLVACLSKMIKFKNEENN